MAKSQHSLYFGTRARLFKITNIQDPMLKRMLTKLQNLEKAALPQEELQEVMDGAPRSPGTWSLPPRVEWAVQVGSQSAWAGGRRVGGRAALPWDQQGSRGWWEYRYWSLTLPAGWD